MEESFGNWLAGFTDGEGCFCIYVPKRKKTEQPINLLFSINLRLDDIEILKEIKRELDCGRLSIRENRKNSKSKPCVSFVVSKLSDLKNIIIPLFKNFPLRAKKKRDFDIWSKAVELAFDIQNKPYNKTTQGGLTRWTEEDRKQMQSLCSFLKEIRSFRRPVIEKKEIPEDKIKYVKKMLVMDTETIDSKAAAILIGIGRQGIEMARKRNNVVCLKAGKRRNKYPKWQFEKDIWEYLPRILKFIGYKGDKRGDKKE